jgi:adenosylhomocysteine nucleosidase
MSLIRLAALSLLLLAPIEARAASPPADPVPRIALFSAFAPEWKALLAIIDQPFSRREKGVEFVTGRVEGHDVVLVLSGVSMVNAAMTAQMAVDRYELRALLFSGIAGGVDPALHIGDVVVADRWAEYLENIRAGGGAGLCASIVGVAGVRQFRHDVSARRLRAARRPL